MTVDTETKLDLLTVTEFGGQIMLALENKAQARFSILFLGQETVARTYWTIVS